MDDLLVIILTLIFAAVGIFGQSKKKKAQQANQPVPQPQPEERDSFWDFLEEEETKPRQSRVETQPEQTYRPPQQSTEKEKPEPVQKAQPAQKESSIYSTDLTGINEMANQRKSKSKIRFSLRKAVIYSEILNRKYT
jgi:cell division protein FtsN